MTPEEETLEKIKFVLLCKNDSQAIRIIEQYGDYKKDQALQLLQTGVIKSVCDRVNNFENNRCINCGAKAGHKCELQTVL